MKKFSKFFLLAAVATLGCGGKDKEKSEYASVSGVYLLSAVEVENTYSCGGPRGDLGDVRVNIRQDKDDSSEVWFEGGGVKFGGPDTLSPSSEFTVEDYELREGVTLDYEGAFTVENGKAISLEGTLRVEVETGGCEGNGGYNAVEIEGLRVDDVSEAGIAPSRVRFEPR